MTPQQYQQLTLETAVYPGAGSGSLLAINYTALGLAGEVGELLNKFKKIYRGDVSLQASRAQLLDEAGDVLWYLIRLADELDSSLPDLMERNAQKLLQRQALGTIQGSGDNR